MSEENVEQLDRITEASNRRDIPALLKAVDPEVEWVPAFPTSLGGRDRPVYRGHDGIRQMFEEFYEALDEIYVEYSDVRELGDRVIAIGRVRTRGKVSGAVTEEPFALTADFRDGKAFRVLTTLEPREALEAAGLEW